MTNDKVVSLDQQRFRLNDQRQSVQFGQLTGQLRRLMPECLAQTTKVKLLNFSGITNWQQQQMSSNQRHRQEKRGCVNSEATSRVVSLDEKRQIRVIRLNDQSPDCQFGNPTPNQSAQTTNARVQTTNARVVGLDDPSQIRVFSSEDHSQKSQFKQPTTKWLVQTTNVNLFNFSGYERIGSCSNGLTISGIAKRKEDV